MKEHLKPALTLAVVCGIITALLSLVYNITKPIIDEATREKAVSLCKTVYPDGESFEELSVSDENSGKARSVYLSPDGGVVVAAIGEGGYGGSIVVMVGINKGAVTGTAVLESTETEGIGTRVEAPEFSARFSGKTKDECQKADAIAGATRSSTAYKNAIKNAFAVYEGMCDGE